MMASSKHAAPTVAPLTASENEIILTESECAHLLSISPTTMYALRKSGLGPSFSRISPGRSASNVRYLKSLVVQWLVSRIETAPADSSVDEGGEE